MGLPGEELQFEFEVGEFFTVGEEGVYFCL